MAAPRTGQRRNCKGRPGRRVGGIAKAGVCREGNGKARPRSAGCSGNPATQPENWLLDHPVAQKANQENKPVEGRNHNDVI